MLSILQVVDFDRNRIIVILKSKLRQLNFQKGVPLSCFNYPDQFRSPFEQEISDIVKLSIIKELLCKIGKKWVTVSHFAHILGTETLPNSCFANQWGAKNSLVNKLRLIQGCKLCKVTLYDRFAMVQKSSMTFMENADTPIDNADKVQFDPFLGPIFTKKLTIANGNPIKKQKQRPKRWIQRNQSADVNCDFRFIMNINY